MRPLAAPVTEETAKAPAAAETEEAAAPEAPVVEEGTPVADEEDFECALSENSITLRQFHSMWVAYCILNDCEVDTATYDSQIARLWNAISNNTTNPFINFTDFDNYMCEDLV